MAVRVWRRGVLRVLIVARPDGGEARALQVKAVLHERDAQAGSGSVLGGVGCVEEVGEEEAGQLEGHGDHAVPDEGEERADGEAVDVHLIWAAQAGREDGGLPVRGSGICCCLLVGLIM